MSEIHRKILLDEFINKGLFAESDLKIADMSKSELDMGIKVEMEHTSNKELSKKIALDHLAEIPDYYTRLAKMEADAKAEGKLS